MMPCRKALAENRRCAFDRGVDGVAERKALANSRKSEARMRKGIVLRASM